MKVTNKLFQPYNHPDVLKSMYIDFKDNFQSFQRTTTVRRGMGLVSFSKYHNISISLSELIIEEGRKLSTK